MNQDNLKTRDTKENITSRDNIDIIHKNVRSGVGLLVTKMVNTGLEILKTLVFTLILSPDDFGVVGAGLILINTITLISNTQIEQSLIQKKDDIRPYLNSAWSFNVLKSILLSGTLASISPLIAILFNDPRVVPVIITLAIMSGIRDCKNIGIIYLQKNLNFNKIILSRLAMKASAFIIIFPLYIFIKDYWLMVISYSVAFVLEFIFSFIIHPYRPNFKIDKSKLMELINFTKWIILSGIIGFFNIQMDDYIVGTLFVTEVLGLYQLARYVGWMPANQISYVIAEITFPSFSILQDSKEKLKTMFMKTFQIVIFVTVPYVLFVLLFADEAVFIFLKKAWYPIIVLIQLFTIRGSIAATTSIAGPLQKGVGKPSSMTKNQLSYTIVFYTLLTPFIFFWQIHGLLFAAILAAIAVFIAQYRTSLGYIDCKVRDLLPHAIYPISIALGTAFVVIIARYTFFTAISLTNLIILLSIAAGTYVAFGLLLEKFTSFEFLALIMKIKNIILKNKKR
ncbi:MAG: oligosaccharide flippase family protein [Promethearchaeota archaeon]